MARPHLVQTMNPLNDGESATSMCGCVIFKAEIGGYVNGDWIEMEVDSLIEFSCPECQKHEWKERYLYAVREVAND